MFRNIFSSSGSVTINGRRFHGKSISIVNNKVMVDGKEVLGEENLVGPLSIEVHGDVSMLEVQDGTVNAGSVGTVKTMSGDVHCEDIKGSVSTMSGDVNCRGPIGGDVSTMSGDISHA